MGHPTYNGDRCRKRTYSPVSQTEFLKVSIILSQLASNSERKKIREPGTSPTAMLWTPSFIIESSHGFLVLQAIFHRLRRQARPVLPHLPDLVDDLSVNAQLALLKKERRHHRCARVPRNVDGQSPFEQRIADTGHCFNVGAVFSEEHDTVFHPALHEVLSYSSRDIDLARFGLDRVWATWRWFVDIAEDVDHGFGMRFQPLSRY
jgi:hypothetical protein